MDDPSAGVAAAHIGGKVLADAEGHLAALTKEITSLHAALPGASKPVSPRQERLKVSG